MMVRWSGEVQVNVISQSELEIGGRETCSYYIDYKSFLTPVFSASVFQSILVCILSYIISFINSLFDSIIRRIFGKRPEINCSFE